MNRNLEISFSRRVFNNTVKHKIRGKLGGCDKNVASNQISVEAHQVSHANILVSDSRQTLCLAVEEVVGSELKIERFDVEIGAQPVISQRSRTSGWLRLSTLSHAEVLVAIIN